MIRSRRGLLITGVVVFLGSLILMFPARVAVEWFAPEGIAISGIQGTLWNGRAAEASLGGLYFRDVSWRLRPLQVFGGKLSYAVAAKPVSGFVETVASIGFGGAMELSELKAALPLSLFADAAGVSGLDGNASFDFERVRIVDDLAVVADGNIQVANLIVPIVGRDSLGAYQAEFQTQEDAIVASIEDTDGVVELAGSLHVNNDRTFRFLSQVVAKPETPQSIRQQLKFLPPPNERGQQELRLEGTL